MSYLFLLPESDVLNETKKPFFIIIFRRRYWWTIVPDGIWRNHRFSKRTDFRTWTDNHWRCPNKNRTRENTRRGRRRKYDGHHERKLNSPSVSEEKTERGGASRDKRRLKTSREDTPNIRKPKWGKKASSGSTRVADPSVSESVPKCSRAGTSRMRWECGSSHWMLASESRKEAASATHAGPCYR